MNTLTGKVAIVTGASKGIGASIAKYLAAEGAAVVVNYSSSKTGADRVVSEIASNGGKAIAVQANVANEPEIARLFAETKKAFGKLELRYSALMARYGTVIEIAGRTIGAVAGLVGLPLALVAVVTVASDHSHGELVLQTVERDAADLLGPHLVSAVVEWIA